MSTAIRTGERPAEVIDSTLLAELWDAHADRLLLIARAIGGPAEDAVQEAFVTLAAQRTLPADPMAWLVRVARNHLLQWHRGNRRRRDRESLAGQRSWFERQRRAAPQTLEAAEVTEALHCLPSPQKEIIVMHLWGEMSFEAIAQVVGGSRSKAHRHFRSGLKELKQKLDPVEADAFPAATRSFGLRGD